jgi:hypothetical protein
VTAADAVWPLNMAAGCLCRVSSLLSSSGDEGAGLTLLEDIISLPDLCSLHSSLTSLETQIELFLNLKAKLINSDSKWETIDRRCRNRALEDKKVPPGSNLVQRTAVDVRYLLSLLCLNIGQLEELRENSPRTKQSPVVLAYREALTWFPRSIEGGLLLGTALRHIVINEDELLLVQEFWEKAIGGINSVAAISSECDCSLCHDQLQRLNDRAVSRAREASHKLRSALILHYCQAGRMDSATPHLVSGRYVFVLSQEILHYPLSASLLAPAPHCAHAMGVDNALPLTHFRRLQHIFRPDSPFWSEHHYDFYSNASRSVGYFSYLSHFRESAGRPSRTVIEQVIRLIYQTVIQKFPEVESEATVGKSVALLLLIDRPLQRSGGSTVGHTPAAINFISILTRQRSTPARQLSTRSSPVCSTSLQTLSMIWEE